MDKSCPKEKVENQYHESSDIKCFKGDNYRCKECGATNKETRLHVDHIVPVAKGGTNDLSNLQTLCEKCNRAKYTDEWIGGEIYSNQSKKINADDKWKKCPNCGALIPKAVKICHYCKNDPDYNVNKRRRRVSQYKESSTRCPYCGYYNSAYTSKCWRCGRVLSKNVKTCPNCGNDIHEKFNKCWRCGEIFSEFD